MSIILARLDDDDRRDLHAALNNAAVTTAGIFRALRARGHTIADSTIARHRRHDCQCP